MSADAECRLIYGYAIPKKKFIGGYYAPDLDLADIEEAESDKEESSKSYKIKTFYYEPSGIMFIGFQICILTNFDYEGFDEEDLDFNKLRSKLEDYKETLKYMVRDKKLLERPALWAICYKDVF
ncbi:MAG: hypothetical protein ACTSRZ_16225 [Promethearchaeota archaeon]